ncbi:MAG: hypothetical protein E6K94_05560 [Thaumarchaeota archaeon]|nr:MAG: hypothetical protein E6K94_05560 [Nitrososphaerota archaeon]
MTRPLTLLIKETLELPKVKQFLNSKARNSEATKKGYSIALAHFQTFLSSSEYNVETVLNALVEKKIDVYELLEQFIEHLKIRQDEYMNNTKLSNRTILFYITGLKSYLEYYDIEFSAKKLKSKVTMPKVLRRMKKSLNAEDIRNILLACNNVRLKLFILVLASSGLRSIEALSLRNCDIDFSQSPTTVHIMAENTKTKQERESYISDEASTELKQNLNQNIKMIIISNILLILYLLNGKLTRQTHIIFMAYYIIFLLHYFKELIWISEKTVKAYKEEKYRFISLDPL